MNAEKASKKGLKKFDYTVLMLPHSAPSAEKEERLDALGEKGWELVALSGETAIFKRLIP